MIRSLFLVGILITLVAIAFKQPEQSALEFAQEVTEKAQATMASKMPQSVKSKTLTPEPLVAQTPPPAGEAWRDISGRIRTAVKRAGDRGAGPNEPPVESLPKILPPTIPRKARRLRQETLPAAPSIERLLPRKATAGKRIEPPAMPSAPVLDVATESLGKAEHAPAMSGAKSLKLADPGLVEVRANLENAARLLAEVK